MGVRGPGKRCEGENPARAHPTPNPTLHQTAPVRTARSEQPGEYERANTGGLVFFSFWVLLASGVLMGVLLRMGGARSPHLGGFSCSLSLSLSLSLSRLSPLASCSSASNLTFPRDLRGLTIRAFVHYAAISASHRTASHLSNRTPTATHLSFTGYDHP